VEDGDPASKWVRPLFTHLAPHSTIKPQKQHPLIFAAFAVMKKTE
jgi:hypothetical protein